MPASTFFIVAPSLLLDARGLDDGPPFLDVGLLLRDQRGRRLPLARRDFHAKAGQTLAHRRIAERVLYGGIEFGNDRRGRAGRRPESAPQRHMQAPHAPLLLTPAGAT